MSTDGDPYGLQATIDNVVDTANEALQSGALSERETEEIERVLNAFENSTAALAKMPDDIKLNLISVINGALTIGAICRFSESIVSNVARHRMRTQSAIARSRRAEKRKPQNKAVDEAIAAALNGHHPINRFSKEAAAILDEVNRLLKKGGNSAILVDVIYRKLKIRAAQSSRS